MAGYQDRRLEKLETALPERPPMVVISGDTADAVAEALEAYYAATPEDEWAELVVVVRW
jgi:UDP-N-acetylglucosamine 2-epimerase